MFIVTMTLKPVPHDVYMKRGKAENEYTQSLMASGVISQFYVTENHRHYWIVFDVESEQVLEKKLQGFPLYSYFEYKFEKVIDMVAAVAGGLTDPNLE
ncbi:muconolactone Delta-isomerase [Oceanicoccus sagamiensis]|uniref:Muconolactone isomerase domain-containing protein n=1 Tax=Oceanicoccus sagamiensis TaxID=716816 RepID=A0A1X9NKW8_9GAMM|nr:muconolactone Delta-isomerase family protein [Oceanicoccus sagamiensis]ARN76069.1 hypothetical protein BST96_19395 [Oceanicoccus sagamiensis]